MKLKSPYLVKPNAKLKLSRIASDDTGSFKHEDAANAVLDRHREEFAKLQEVFYASQQKALLIVLQGMDTSGKDGAISHIFCGINPQGCNVSSFKEPTPVEKLHDFLWRVHSQVPPRGMIQIFNRSHYEDILVPRVHKLISAGKLNQHIDDILEFESMLYDNQVIVLKFFLHISYEEQARRLQSRIDDPEKHWKLSESDFRERGFWSQYEDAYNHVIGATSRKHAPWFIIPSDHKWYRNVAISEVLVKVMKDLKLDYPKPTMDPSKIKL
jgi:PPK2 family polyphosphate:nucleotide phosphotransferase